MRMGYGEEPAPVTGHRPRAALRLNTVQLIEDILVLVRRQRKVRGDWHRRVRRVDRGLSPVHGAVKPWGRGRVRTRSSKRVIFSCVAV